MKRVIKSITASHEMPVHKNMYFTPEDVVQLLLQIEELQSCDVVLTQSADGSAAFMIGNSVYYLSDENNEVC